MAVAASDSGSNTERPSLAVVNTIWNITKQRITERMIGSPDQASAVNGPNRPPKPPARGSLPDPISDFIKTGR
jgi:hypothetical protein